MSEPPNMDPAHAVARTLDHPDRALLDFPSEQPRPRPLLRSPVVFRSSALAAAFGFGLLVGGVSVWSSGDDAADPAIAGAALSIQPHEAADVSLRAESDAVAAPPVHAARPVLRKAVAAVAASSKSDASRRFFRGSLLVESAPAGAQVFLNGRAAGRTPLLLKDQPVGSRAVRVVLDGYGSWTSAVQIVTDRQVRVRAQLTGPPTTVANR